MRRSIFSVALLALAGCATNPDQAAKTTAVPVPPGMAKVTITRSSGEMLYMGAPAKVEIGREHVASLWRGETYSGPVRPGDVTITTSGTLAPGRFNVTFKAAPNQHYRFVVTPRPEHFSPISVVSPLGGLIASHIEGGGPFKIDKAP